MSQVKALVEDIMVIKCLCPKIPCVCGFKVHTHGDIGRIYCPQCGRPHNV